MTDGMADRVLYGPHCNHDDLCGMFGCDQRGHIDFSCRRQATCSYCHPSKPCPMDSSVSVADCPECRIEHDDVTTPSPPGGGVVSPAGPVEHATGCYLGDWCVECGSCACGAIPSLCGGPGCYTVDEHNQWHDDNDDGDDGDGEVCSYV